MNKQDNIMVSRELLERLKLLLSDKNCEEVNELHEVLHPAPVTVQDYIDAGRGDEILPGMWVEGEYGSLGIIPFNRTSDHVVFAIDPADHEEGWAFNKETAKPRFDLRPAFQPDGTPFPAESIESQPQQP